VLCDRDGVVSGLSGEDSHSASGSQSKLFVVLVSVLILNYNYARLLPEAIESVLAQTYPRIETIVVDDGSTDNSREVIASYDDRLISVFKENGGLTSAVNAAFERSSGDLISFLDADDAFEPEKVERVVGAARRVPQAYLIHHQMQLVDEGGKAMHRPFPARVPDGDIRALVARTGGWFPHAVMSGQTFTRAYAQRMFPVPEQQDFLDRGRSHILPIFPDTYLPGPAALCAPVAGIQAPLTRYRLHGKNMTFATQAASGGPLLRYRAEAETLSTVMREKFGESRPLQMEDHLAYQLLRYAAGEISWGYAIGRVVRCPYLPAMLKVREVLRVSMKRGTAGAA
jgi:glycosyltransferase involved in cell wall biosynthesis